MGEEGNTEIKHESIASIEEGITEGAMGTRITNRYNVLV